MSVVGIENDGSVAVIKMTNGENRHNKVFEESMSSALDEVAGDESITAAVLTSTDSKNWSQGIDLEWLMQQMNEKNTDMIRQFLHGMDQVFRKLLVLPVPVIAAINGHAYANGAILATHCDFRFMRSDRGFFCLPEVNLDIQFTPAMHRLFYHKYPSFVVNRLMLTGERMTAPELEKHQIIEKACANTEETMKESMAFAKTFQKKRDTFGKLKQMSNQQIIDAIDNLNPLHWIDEFQV